jgi:hypothetical protein
MKRLRSSHEILSSRVLLLSDENNENDPALLQLKKLALDNMPETILPYVLYLLSYHPEFPTSSNLEQEGDKKKVQNILSSVKMVINNLMNSLKRDSNNLSYLLKQVNTIVQDYVDCNDPANIGLHFISRLTIQVLKESIKTSENASIYPGEIVLPMTLFERVHRRRNAHNNNNDEDSEYAHLIDVVENTQETFEKVFQEKVKKNINKTQRNVILSPTSSRPKGRNPRKGETRAKRVMIHSVKTNANNDDDDGGDDEETVVSKKSRKEGIDLNHRHPPSITISTSSRPVRATRTQVNYKEKEETDREVLRWEQAAAAAAVTTTTTSSPVRNRISKSGSNNMAGRGAGKPLSGTATATTFTIWKEKQDKDKPMFALKQLHHDEDEVEDIILTGNSAATSTSALTTISADESLRSRLKQRDLNVMGENETKTDLKSKKHEIIGI